MAHKINYRWWTQCSGCGGNADRYEPFHLRGGRQPGQNNPTKHWIETSESTLDHLNGCLADFNEPDVQAY